jgi:hypothetical protein
MTVVVMAMTVVVMAMTVVVMAMTVVVMAVAMVLVAFIGGDFFASCFFREEFAVQGVTIGDVSLMSCRGNVVLFVSFCSKQVVLRRELEMMGGFAVGMGGGHKKFVVLFRCFVMLGHIFGMVNYCL